MKLALIALLGLMFQIPEPKEMGPKLEEAEYNLGACGGNTFAEVHVILSNTKNGQEFTFTYSTTSVDGEIEKETVPPTFTVSLTGKKLENGDVIFRSHEDDYVHGGGKIIKLDFDGRVNGDKLVAVMLVDGELGHVYYGRKARVDDMIKTSEEDFLTCVAFAHIPLEQLPAALMGWLHDKK